MLNEYRCTRCYPYADLKEPKRSDKTIRQGYYVQARSEQEARKLLVERLKQDGIYCDGDRIWGFTCDLWRRGKVPHDVSSGCCET